MKGKFDKTIITALIDQAVVSGGSLVISIIAARQLGPGGFGAYVLANGLYLFLAGFQNAFVIAPMSVYGSATNQNVPSYIWSSNMAQRYFSLVIALICMIVSLISEVAGSSREVYSAYLGAGFAGFFTLSSDFWRQVLLSRRKLREALFCDILNRTVAIGLLLGAIIFLKEISIPAFYVCLAIASGLASLLSARAVRKLVSRCEKSEWLPYLHKNWNFGKWMSADYAITIGTGQIGPYFLASTVGVAATGVLGAVNQLTGILHVFLNGVANYAYPELVREYSEKGKEALLVLTRKMTGYLSAGVSLIIIPALVFAPDLVRCIYSAEYEQSGLTAFRIICCAGFVLAVSRPLDMAMRVMEQVRIRSVISLVEFIFVSSIMYPAIKMYGISGAAAVLLIGRCLVAICLLVILSRDKLKSSNTLADQPII